MLVLNVQTTVPTIMVLSCPKDSTKRELVRLPTKKPVTDTAKASPKYFVGTLKTSVKKNETVDKYTNKPQKENVPAS